MPAAKPPEAPFKPNLHVVARFLDALAAGPHTASALQRAAGVNYDIFRRYLELLEAKGYVARASAGDAHETLSLTREGRRVRDDLRALLARFLELDPSAPPRPASAGANAAAAPDGP